MWGLAQCQSISEMQQCLFQDPHRGFLCCSAVIQDKAASSSMDAALDLTEIHGLLRKAICLLKGCEISFDNGDFVFAVTSVVPWFKVRLPWVLDFAVSCRLFGCSIMHQAYLWLPVLLQVIERYPMTGESRSWRRRDLRKGEIVVLLIIWMLCQLSFQIPCHWVNESRNTALCC